MITSATQWRYQKLNRHQRARIKRALWRAQDKSCGLCGVKIASKRVGDYILDHVTSGHLRGLLCKYCRNYVRWIDKMRRVGAKPYVDPHQDWYLRDPPIGKLTDADVHEVRQLRRLTGF